MTAGLGHTCAIQNSGAAFCWGANNNSQLGNNASGIQRVPSAVSGLSSGVAQIGAGANHTCAAMDDGSARCWGLNTNGQVGDGSNSTRTTPVTVSALSGALRLAGGSKHTCAAQSSGQASCWGAGNFGQLGDGGTTDSNTPVSVTFP
jgi:alpha-tubulin suppressor-like RCC1 family protein